MNFFDGFSSNGNCGCGMSGNGGCGCNMLWLLMLTCCCGTNLCDLLPILMILCCCGNKNKDCSCSGGNGCN